MRWILSLVFVQGLLILIGGWIEGVIDEGNILVIQIDWIKVYCNVKKPTIPVIFSDIVFVVVSILDFVLDGVNDYDVAENIL